jgi:hypothetical protein
MSFTPTYRHMGDINNAQIREFASFSDEQSSKHIQSHHHKFTDRMMSSLHLLVVTVKPALIFFLRMNLNICSPLRLLGKYLRWQPLS